MNNHTLAVLATVLAGGFIALQAPINATLGRAVGSPIAAASISFAVGTAALVTVRELGAGAVTAATVTGQLATSLLIDRLGVLGLESRPLSLERLVGVVLLVAGTVLVARGR